MGCFQHWVLLEMGLCAVPKGTVAIFGGKEQGENRESGVRSGARLKVGSNSDALKFEASSALQ